MDEYSMNADPDALTRFNAAAQDRVNRAWMLRVLGASWDQVAEQVGYSTGSNACRAVREAMGELPQPQRDELRDLWRSRIEVLWRQSLRDVNQQRPGALSAGVRIAERAARLDGLDAPEVHVITPTTRELDEWVAEMLAAGGQGIPDVEEADVIVIDGEVVEDDDETTRH